MPTLNLKEIYGVQSIFSCNLWRSNILNFFKEKKYCKSNLQLLILGKEVGFVNKIEKIYLKGVYKS